MGIIWRIVRLGCQGFEGIGNQFFMLIRQHLKLGGQGWFSHNNGNAAVSPGHLQPAMVKVLGIRLEITGIQTLEIVAAELAYLMHNFILPAYLMGGVAIAIQLGAQILPVFGHAGGLRGRRAVALSGKRGLILAAGAIECRHA